MTPIVKTAIGLAIVLVAVFGVLLLMPASQPATPAGAISGLGVTVNEGLAQRGASLFSTKYGCSACHAVSSLGVSGSAAGPDLSRVLVAEVPAGTRPEANSVAKWYAEHGRANPETKPDQAAELLSEFLEKPPAYSPVMQAQVQRLKGVAGGEEQWEKDVQALVEFLKKAAVGK